MILVTGGTGLVGAHLLYALLKKHPKVRATHRATSDLDAIKQVFSSYGDSRSFDRIQWVVADITEIPALTDAFIGITRVYHCAAFISFNPKHLRPLRKINTEGTAHIVNLCLNNHIEKLCYVSSIATLSAKSDSSHIDEESDWNPEEDNGVYAITKYGAEMEVWRGVQEGLNAVIVNPGVILGEGFWDTGSGTIVKNAARGVNYYTPGGTGFVDVLDVVKAIVMLMDSDIKNERYVLVGENMYYKDVLSRLAYHFGNKAPTKKLGKGTLIFLSRLDAVRHSFFGGKRKLIRSMVNSLFTSSVYDSSKIERDLNFQFTPMDKTIKRVVENYSSSSKAVSD
ncbi:MAG: NAD-dependent epimerase/dehydratase family protein [Bacteroidota bacterium]